MEGFASAGEGQGGDLASVERGKVTRPEWLIAAAEAQEMTAQEGENEEEGEADEQNSDDLLEEEGAEAGGELDGQCATEEGVSAAAALVEAEMATSLLFSSSQTRQIGAGASDGYGPCGGRQRPAPHLLQRPAVVEARAWKW
jgi:hypothetical protein